MSPRDEVLGRLGQEYDELPVEYRFIQGHSRVKKYLVLSPFANHEYYTVTRRMGASITPTASGIGDSHRVYEASQSLASSSKDRKPATALDRSLVTCRHPRAAKSPSLRGRFAIYPRHPENFGRPRQAGDRHWRYRSLGGSHRR
ncbi:hypothetical protein ACKRZS_001902 [Fusarium odoratissimum]